MSKHFIVSEKGILVTDQNLNVDSEHSGFSGLRKVMKLNEDHFLTLDNKSILELVNINMNKIANLKMEFLNNLSTTPNENEVAICSGRGLSFVSYQKDA